MTFGTQWKSATDYAFASASKRWLEDGNEGEPTLAHLQDWIPYYLAQQWDYTFPAGSIWTHPANARVE